jgi:hypothetical protein
MKSYCSAPFEIQPAFIRGEPCEDLGGAHAIADKKNYLCCLTCLRLSCGRLHLSTFFALATAAEKKTKKSA